MHTSALNKAKWFFDKYQPQSVVEVGAMDVCGGTMRSQSSATRYVGIDLESGPNVDIVSIDPYRLPICEELFDAAVCTSTFEHCPLFWMLFFEMVLATRPGGFIYANAPSNGVVHRYPVDCWRFYPDAGQALADYATLRGIRVEVLETGISDPDGSEPDAWRDWFCVWRRA